MIQECPSVEDISSQPDQQRLTQKMAELIDDDILHKVEFKKREIEHLEQEIEKCKSCNLSQNAHVHQEVQPNFAHTFQYAYPQPPPMVYYPPQQQYQYSPHVFTAPYPPPAPQHEQSLS
jgi:hypothetical protein